MNRTSNIKLKFGRYKGKAIKDVPTEYLKWCIRMNVLRGRALRYAKYKTNYPTDTYKITTDGSAYCVQAYDKHDASRQYYGKEEFKVEKLQNVEI